MNFIDCLILIISLYILIKILIIDPVDKSFDKKWNEIKNKHYLFKPKKNISAYELAEIYDYLDKIGSRTFGTRTLHENYLQDVPDDLKVHFEKLIE